MSYSRSAVWVIIFSYWIRPWVCSWAAWEELNHSCWLMLKVLHRLKTSLAQEPINKYKLQSPFVVQSASCRSNDEKKQWHDSKFSHRYIFVFKIKGFPAEYLVQSHSWRIHKYSVVLGHIQKKKNSHSLSWLNVQKQSPFMNFTDYCLIVVLASFCMHITNPLLISLAFEQTELMQTISPGQRPWA